MIQPIILAGGSGKRLWPLSRESYPKQFLALANSKTSLLQDTALRIADRTKFLAPIVICNNQHRFLVAEQFRQINIECKIVLEPFGKNTAPAIIIATLLTENISKASSVLIMPADHLLQDADKFNQAIDQAEEFLESGQIVTFGIKPNRPETGYGYIKVKQNYIVEKFIEKPRLEIAKQLFKTGTYLWNSGIFFFKTQALLAEAKIFHPAMFDVCKNIINSATTDLDFIKLDPDLFTKLPNISVDYAIMEQTSKATCIKIDTNWNDLGDFRQLSSTGKKDKNDNVISGDIIATNSKNCFLKSESRLVAAIGVTNYTIVETSDAVLVCNNEYADEIKNVVTSLESNSHKSAKYHKKVFRPWGYFESIELGKNFQVKKLSIYKSKSISLQLHHHRSEHWIVVNGLAKVEKGKSIQQLTKNQSVYIPAKTKHRLSNIGDEILEVIEVQSGDYLGEDDIVRFEDQFNRVLEQQDN